MENDQGRFRAVVMGVVLISIASMPPLVVIQTKGTGKERKIKTAIPFQLHWLLWSFFVRKSNCRYKIDPQSQRLNVED